MIGLSLFPVFWFLSSGNVLMFATVALHASALGCFVISNQEYDDLHLHSLYVLSVVTHCHVCFILQRHHLLRIGVLINSFTPCISSFLTIQHLAFSVNNTDALHSNLCTSHCAVSDFPHRILEKGFSQGCFFLSSERPCYRWTWAQFLPERISNNRNQVIWISLKKKTFLHLCGIKFTTEKQHWVRFHDETSAVFLLVIIL